MFKNFFPNKILLLSKTTINSLALLLLISYRQCALALSYPPLTKISLVRKLDAKT